MFTRHLGSSGPGVSALGLGTLAMGGAYGPVDEAEALATIRRGLDLGVNLLDTADFYGPRGTAETIIGRAVAGRRKEVVIASKTGLRSVPGGLPRPCGTPEFLKARVEGSLRRLGTDYIDIYYLVRVDPRVPVDESVGALAELVAEGKIKHIGLCEASARTFLQASAVHEIVAVQTEFALWERRVETEILPVLHEFGAALVACRPLGGGFLAGGLAMDRLDLTDHRRDDPRLRGANLYRNMTALREIEDFAAKHHATAAQAALAWVLSRGEEIVAVPGAKRRDHVEENAAAADLMLSLTEDEVQELAAAVPQATGARYQPDLLSMIDT